MSLKFIQKKIFFLIFPCVCLLISGCDDETTPEEKSAKAGIQYLASVMDEYHNRFPVYDDVSSAGNHFVSYGKIPDQNARVEINGSWVDSPHSGATAIRCELLAGGSGGFYFLNGVLAEEAAAPAPNFGAIPNAGIDLTGAESLTFWAKGEVGGEVIEFFVAGVGRNPSNGQAIEPYPGSSPRQPAVGTMITLGKEWRQYTIDVSGLDLSYVLGGFGWFATSASNQDGAVFYLDDIQYNLGEAARKARLAQPRFLRSFETLPLQPDPTDGDKDDDIDLVLRNLAFTYDNAVALIAFIADGSDESLKRAMLIGDAFVYASRHDRFYTDGRIRTAYMAGDIILPPGWLPNGKAGTVPIPGFYVENGSKFIEVEQGSVDVGNNAWAMIALLALYLETGNQDYLLTAQRIGEFIHQFRNDSGSYQGFLGGVKDPEGKQTQRTYASVEHNIDIYAAFNTLFNITGEPRWLNDAKHAETFVESMWDSDQECFLAGTSDPETRNNGEWKLPSDVQSWNILGRMPFALRNSEAVLNCAEKHHRTTNSGFSGFDFNNDKDGIWFEGTAHMALAYQEAGLFSQAAQIRKTLREVQRTPPFGDGYGIVAACKDKLTTGFDFEFYRRFHVAATSWLVLAQREYNPYYRP